MYERDKTRYEQELQEYTTTGHFTGKGKGKGKPIKEDIISDIAEKQDTEQTESRLSMVISPTLSSLSDSSALGSGFPLAQIPSPTLTPTDESNFTISAIPSPTFQ